MPKNTVAPGQSTPGELTNDDLRAIWRGYVGASNAQVVGEAIFNGGSLAGLIQTRRTHRSPKRIADFAGLRIRKGDAQQWTGKAYWIAQGQSHPLAGVEYRTMDALRQAIGGAK